MHTCNTPTRAHIHKHRPVGDGEDGGVPRVCVCLCGATRVRVKMCVFVLVPAAAGCSGCCVRRRLHIAEFGKMIHMDVSALAEQPHTPRLPATNCRHQEETETETEIETEIETETETCVCTSMLKQKQTRHTSPDLRTQTQTKISQISINLSVGNA